jgi:hypothetical protein
MRAGRAEAAAVAFERVGTRSKVLIPCAPGGPILGVLCEVFAGVLDRRRMELSLAERLRFEKLLSFLAASHRSAADFDAAVQRGLRQVAVPLPSARSAPGAPGPRICSSGSICSATSSPTRAPRSASSPAMWWIWRSCARS